jgi:hypothetical protein
MIDDCSADQRQKHTYCWAYYNISTNAKSFLPKLTTIQPMTKGSFLRNRTSLQQYTFAFVLIAGRPKSPISFPGLVQSGYRVLQILGMSGLETKPDQKDRLY